MDDDKRKATLTLVGIGLIIFLAILYFLWGTFLNQGTLIISGTPAPFQVEIFEGEKLKCSVSPCKIKQRTGEKTLIISKEGYRTVVTEVEVKLWRKIDLPIELEANPTINKTTALPETMEKEYELVMDENRQMQKLIDKSDSRQRALIYFTERLKAPKIIGQKDYLLILDNAAQKAYKVDLKLKTKEEIGEVKFSNITDGKWSLDGKYLVFTREENPGLWLFDSDNNNVKQLDLFAGFDEIDWSAQGLAFATLASLQAEARVGKYQNYIRLLPAQSFSEGLTFGFYHPDEDSYTGLGTFPEFINIPEKIVVTSNGQSIYFQLKEEYFVVK